MECPVFDTHSWVTGPPLNKRRVAIVTTAGLHRRTDNAFLLATTPDQARPVDYRVIPGAGHFFNNPGETELMLKHVGNYIDQNLALRSLASMRETVALTEAEPGRKRLSLPEVLPLSAWKQRKAGA